jgi:hypothetical protein
MLLRICGERRADSFDSELNFLKNARDNRIDRHLTLWPSANDIAGARRVSCSIPPGFHFHGSERGEDFFPPGSQTLPLPEPAISGKDMLWREHAFQGRCQPGRRAVPEETSYESDQQDSTLREAISQVKMMPRIKLISFIYNQIEF